MSGIGPSLPPHLLAKRKRSDDLSDEDEVSDDAPEDQPETKKLRNIGPALPSSSAALGTEQSRQPDTSDDSGLKLSPAKGPKTGKSISNGSKYSTTILPGSNSLARETKTFGPALPPAIASQKDTPAVEDESDSDDDFGPSLPGKAVGETSALATTSLQAEPNQAQSKSGRDDWMLAPPTSGDWTSRIDPSKMKNRGFTSGKGSRGASSGGDMSLWTETPEQKRKRLEDELLGVRKADSGESQNAAPARKHTEDAEMAKKVQAYNDRHRAAPLYSSEKTDADEDDPSKRAFDREKDIAGSKLTHTEQKQMMNKAANFGSRFSKGTYL